MEIQYRYLLERNNLLLDNEDKRFILWIMHNPSTADAKKDDPTIRRCKQFTIDFGINNLKIVNLFAVRSTDPKYLKHLNFQNCMGPYNNKIILKQIKDAYKIIYAFGNVKAHKYRVGNLKEIINAFSSKIIYCLGTTKKGYPLHPLYVKRNTKLFKFDWDKGGIYD